MHDTLTGNLQFDSASAYGILGSFLEPDELDELCSLYSQAADWGALEEKNIERAPGVTFNPPPARLLELAVTKGHCKDLDSLKLAIMLCCNSENLPETKKSVSALLDFNDNKKLTQNEIIVLACYWLDNIRHMHMSSSPEDIKQQQLSNVASKILPLLVSKRSSTLRLFLEKAVERTFRRLS